MTVSYNSHFKNKNCMQNTGKVRPYSRITVQEARKQYSANNFKQKIRTQTAQQIIQHNVDADRFFQNIAMHIENIKECTYQLYKKVKNREKLLNKQSNSLKVNKESFSMVKVDEDMIKLVSELRHKVVNQRNLYNMIDGKIREQNLLINLHINSQDVIDNDVRQFMNCKIKNEDVCPHDNIKIKNLKDLMNHKLVIDFTRELKNNQPSKYQIQFLANPDRSLQISFDDYRKYFGKTIAPELFRDEVLFIETQTNVFDGLDFLSNTQNNPKTMSVQPSSNIISQSNTRRKLTMNFDAARTSVVSAKTMNFGQKKIGQLTQPNTKSILNSLESLNFKKIGINDRENDLVFENFDPENIEEPYKEAIKNLRSTLHAPIKLQNIKMIAPRMEMSQKALQKAQEGGVDKRVLIETTQIQGLEECAELKKVVDRNRLDLQRQKAIQVNYTDNHKLASKIKELRELFDVAIMKEDIFTAKLKEFVETIRLYHYTLTQYPVRSTLTDINYRIEDILNRKNKIDEKDIKMGVIKGLQRNIFQRPETVKKTIDYNMIDVPKYLPFRPDSPFKNYKQYTEPRKTTKLVQLKRQLMEKEAGMEEEQPDFYQ